MSHPVYNVLVKLKIRDCHVDVRICFCVRIVCETKLCGLGQATASLWSGQIVFVRTVLGCAV